MQLYKLIAINLGLSAGKCRHSPTCSLYSKQAISKYGLIHGIWLSIKRLLKCHPWSLGGFDPVP